MVCVDVSVFLSLAIRWYLNWHRIRGHTSSIKNCTTIHPGHPPALFRTVVTISMSSPCNVTFTTSKLSASCARKADINYKAVPVLFHRVFSRSPATQSFGTQKTSSSRPISKGEQKPCRFTASDGAWQSPFETDWDGLRPSICSDPGCRMLSIASSTATSLSEATTRQQMLSPGSCRPLGWTLLRSSRPRAPCLSCFK